MTVFLSDSWLPMRMSQSLPVTYVGISVTIGRRIFRFKFQTTLEKA